MERDAGKYINVQILDSHQMPDLAEIPSLIALIISIILCFLLSVAI